MQTKNIKFQVISICAGVDGKKTSLDKLISRSLYQSFVSKISCNPTAMKKYNKALHVNTDTVHLDLEKIYLLCSKIALHTRLREFQYKIPNRTELFSMVLFLWKGVRDLGTFLSLLLESRKSARFLG